MFDPRTEQSAHPAILNGGFGKWGDDSFSSNDRKMVQNYDQNFRNWNDGLGGVQFRLDTMEEDSGICSPPLWGTSPPQSPTQSRQNSQNRFRFLSPTSRAQAIARGQCEMMEMVKNMPESSYELSLKDIVEQTRLGVEEDCSMNEEKAILGSSGNGNQRWRNEKKGKVLGGTRSIDQNRGMLLKMGYVPFFLGSKKKKVVVTNTTAKVSPKPDQFNEKSAKISVDRDWWRKKLSSVPSKSESGEGSSHSGSTIRSGSIGSSGSSRSGSGSSRSNSSSSRRNSGRHRTVGCWPFFRSKKWKCAN